jgi:hypothetical protein
MASDFENLRLDVSDAGINHFLADKYGSGNATVIGMSSDEKAYMIQTQSGVLTAIDKSAVMSHVKRAESISEMGNVNAGDMIFNTQNDLRAIGITEAMIADGVIDPKIEARLTQQGYPMKRIIADMKAVRTVRFPSRFGVQFTKA